MREAAGADDDEDDGDEDEECGGDFDESVVVCVHDVVAVADDRIVSVLRSIVDRQDASSDLGSKPRRCRSSTPRR